MSDKPDKTDIVAATIAHNGNLRDRIAAVLCETLLAPISMCDAEVLADAVIRELGLRIQVAGPDGIVGTGDYRYVTDWKKADDE